MFPSDIRLAGWVTASALAHLFAVSTGPTGLPSRTMDSQAVFTANISYIVPETPVTLQPLLEPDDRSSLQDAKEAVEKADIPRIGVEPFGTAKMSLQPDDSALHASVPSGSYLGIRDVDVRADPLNEVLLHYPSGAYIRRISGVVRFKLFISVEGELDRAEQLAAEPPGIFEQSAWNAVKQLKFRPALKYGMPVKSEKTIDVVFDPYQGPSTPTEKQPDPSVVEK